MVDATRRRVARYAQGASATRRDHAAPSRRAAPAILTPPLDPLSTHMPACASRDGGDVPAMARWFFEPGHTAAEFSVRHMMVTHVRGHLKNIEGTLDFDPERPEASVVEATIDTRGLWSGNQERDAHLKSADFFDVENHPTTRFAGSRVEVGSSGSLKLHGDLTIRGVTRPVTLDVRYLGQY